VEDMVEQQELCLDTVGVALVAEEMRYVFCYSHELIRNNKSESDSNNAI